MLKSYVAQYRRFGESRTQVFQGFPDPALRRGGQHFGRIISGDASRQIVSHNGTVGLQAREIQEFTYRWPENGLLILHSDGLATHWGLDDYPGLRANHTALEAVREFICASLSKSCLRNNSQFWLAKPVPSSANAKSQGRAS